MYILKSFTSKHVLQFFISFTFQSSFIFVDIISLIRYNTGMEKRSRLLCIKYPQTTAN